MLVSQSSLSKQIKAMEDELGVVLFDRSHGVKLTPVGKQVALHIEAILNEYDRMLFKTKEHQKGGMQKLCIASLYEMVYYGITDMIVTFEHKIANFHIESKECDHARMFSLLESGQTDIAIGYQEFWPAKMNFDVVPLRKDTLALVVNKKHPLAQKTCISLSEARNCVFCFPQEDAALFEFYCESCSKHGFMPQLTRSDVRLSTIKRYILAGMRSTLQIHERAINYFYEPDFTIVNLQDSPTLTLSLLYNRNIISDIGLRFIKYAEHWHRKME